MQRPISIAIETSCRKGGLAIGFGDEPAQAVAFEASARHATQLIGRLDELLRRFSLTPRQLDELYVSAGPGSFTGLRVGITVAKTMTQALPHLRCVAVPTCQAVAYNAADLDWSNLGVVLAAKNDIVHASLYRRRDGRICAQGQPRVEPIGDFLSRAPRPLVLLGEALRHCRFEAQGVAPAAPLDSDLHLPDALGVWQVGHELARAGQYTPPQRLAPIYSRKPEAVRLWEARGGHR